jgi:hypothetical protein
MSITVTNDVFILKDLTSRQRETFTNDDDTPFSLAGKKINIRLVNTDSAGAESVVTLGIGTGITVENAAGGILSWAVTAPQVATLVGDDYVEVNLSIQEADDTVVLVNSYNARKTY